MNPEPEAYQFGFHDLKAKVDGFASEFRTLQKLEANLELEILTIRKNADAEFRKTALQVGENFTNLRARQNEIALLLSQLQTKIMNLNFGKVQEAITGVLERERTLLAALEAVRSIRETKPTVISSQPKRRRKSSLSR